LPLRLSRRARSRGDEKTGGQVCGLRGWASVA
jgi:hypothetical protein